MQKRIQRRTALGMVLSAVLCGGMDVHAQEIGTNAVSEEETVSTYITKDIEVTGELKDPFGNVVTEQSYYRTGGDVNVIDRDMLEKRHYGQLSDALKSVPGVLVRSPGYRGGEFGMENTHSVLSINGDERVVILVDGRRMDNSANNVLNGWSEDGTKSMGDINQIIDMNSIEKIEVIKGTGGSFYGSDATGGVINIITRKGGRTPEGTLDISTGSWNRHNYKLSYSGSLDQDRLKYFFSLSREMGGDLKYKDGISGNTYRWLNTGYKDSMANIRIDYDVDKTHSLRLAHSHMQGDDDYPLVAPDRRYFNAADWSRMIYDWRVNRLRGEYRNPGFRNIRYIWAATGAYNAYNKNNTDLTYVFHRDNGMESFVRIYNQHERYWGSFGMGDAADPSRVPDSPAWHEWVKTHRVGRDDMGWFHHMENYGVQFQLGKAYGKHNVLSTWTYDHSKYNSVDTDTGEKEYMERSSYAGYVQDKIFVSDKFEITPAVRYARYTDVRETDMGGRQTSNGQTNGVFTPSLHMQYAFDKNTSSYLGYTRVHRPLRSRDYTSSYRDSFGRRRAANLQDERGHVWTMGVRRNFSAKTSAALHYDYTWMSNAVVGYSVMDPDHIVRSFYRAVNANEVKKSFNITAQHRFDNHLTLSADYFHAYDRYTAKAGMDFDPDLDWRSGNVNSMINRLRPTNVYKFDLAYDNKKLNTSLTGTWYTGLDTSAFTSSRNLILDFNINYKVHDDMTIYASIENLTNRAYETVFSNYYGKAAYPQPGRSFIVGARYKF